MNTSIRQLSSTALILAGFALLGGGLVTLTQHLTREIIHNQQQQRLQQRLAEVLPGDHYEHPLAAHPLAVRHPPLQAAADQPITVYRVYQNQQPLALLATPVAQDGYSGPIQLLVGTWADGRIAGVRVLAHRETPGLGDAIELARSDWLHSFSNRALGDPPWDDWRVRRDGGVFDQFSGATITPRAVVRALRQWLRYEATHRQQLYARVDGTLP